MFSAANIWESLTMILVQKTVKKPLPVLIFWSKGGQWVFWDGFLVQIHAMSSWYKELSSENHKWWSWCKRRLKETMTRIWCWAWLGFPLSHLQIWMIFNQTLFSYFDHFASYHHHKPTVSKKAKYAKEYKDGTLCWPQVYPRRFTWEWWLHALWDFHLAGARDKT